MSVELRATTAEGDLALSQEALVPPLASPRAALFARALGCNGHASVTAPACARYGRLGGAEQCTAAARACRASRPACLPAVTQHQCAVAHRVRPRARW